MENGGKQIVVESSGRISRLSGGFWIALYFVLASFPLLLLLVGPTPRGGGRWWDFSMGLGFSALAIIGLQFVLTARFRRATSPFGIDIVYYFHRWAALGALALLLGHYLILKLSYPDSLGAWDPRAAPGHMTAGRVGLLVFAVLIASSFWRKQMRIDYDRWRIGHGILAAAGVLLAIWHIQGVGHYTAAPWKAAAWTAYAAVWLALLVYIRLIKPWKLLRRPYRVVSVTPERGDSWTVTVEPVGTHSLAFHAGQFGWLTLGTSPFRAREHPFSFSGSAVNARELQFTIKELGDFTRTVKGFKAGDRAYVDGPHGTFTTELYPEAPGFVMMAGGVGIAPMMSMLRTMADRGDARPVVLLYGSSTWERVLFREALEELRGRLALRLVHVLQAPPADWQGESGFMTEEMLKKHLPDDYREFRYFLCGPVAMTRSLNGILRRLKVPLSHIHSEHFDMV